MRVLASELFSVNGSSTLLTTTAVNWKAEMRTRDVLEQYCCSARRLEG